ncbi:MAG: PA14 domain-containing protein, partial [Bacteroidota bacterium]
NYGIRFTANLFIPKAGEYTFKIWAPASDRLFIDGELVVDNGGKHSAQEVIEKVQLSEGNHQLLLEHVQNTGWNAVGIQYVTPDDNQGRLNSMEESIATPIAREPTPIELDETPYLLRSFVYFPPPKMYEVSAKRTHVISVGEKEGPHYSLDLQNGSLLRAWKEGFADVGEMWVGRGQPQVMSPLGPGFNFDGAPQWTRLENSQSPWPDSLSTGPSFRHLRHELDAAGRPTFTYQFGQGQVADQLIPENGGLTRTLTNKGTSQVHTLLGSAESIVELSPGEFELRSPGIFISILNNEGGTLILQKGNRLDRLIATVPANGNIIYQMQW